MTTLESRRMASDSCLWFVPLGFVFFSSSGVPLANCASAHTRWPTESSDGMYVAGRLQATIIIEPSVRQQAAPAPAIFLPFRIFDFWILLTVEIVFVAVANDGKTENNAHRHRRRRRRRR